MEESAGSFSLSRQLMTMTRDVVNESVAEIVLSHDWRLLVLDAHCNGDDECSKYCDAVAERSSMRYCPACNPTEERSLSG